MNLLEAQKSLVARLNANRRKDARLIESISTAASMQALTGTSFIGIGDFTNNFLGQKHSIAANMPTSGENFLARLALARPTIPSRAEFDSALQRAKNRRFVRDICDGSHRAFEHVRAKKLYGETIAVVDKANAAIQRDGCTTPRSREIVNDARSLTYINTCVASMPSHDQQGFKALAVHEVFTRTRFPKLNVDDVVLCGGTCMEFHKAAINAISKPNDLMLLPAGSFDSLMELPADCNAVPVIIPTDKTGYKLSAKQLSKMIQALTPHLKKQNGQKISCLVLTNPTNPTGLVYTAEELMAIGKVAIQAGIKIIIDEHYAGLDHTSKEDRASMVSMGSLSVSVSGRRHSLHDHCFTIQGTSKLLGTEDYKVGFGLTGNIPWRDAAQASIIKSRLEMTVIEDAFISAAIEERAPHFYENRRYLTARLRELDNGIHTANSIAGRDIYSLLIQPTSGFFACLGIPEELGRSFGIQDATDFAAYLYATTDVYTRPLGGMGLETPGLFTVRVNFSEPTSDESKDVFQRLGALGKAMIAGTASKYNSAIPWTSQSLRSVVRPHDDRPHPVMIGAHSRLIITGRVRIITM